MSFVKYICLVLILSLSHNVVSQSSDLLVNTSVGLIRGLRSENGQYSMFMGIPYASVNPRNPFGEALRYPNFQGVFEAYEDGPSCPQPYLINNTAVGSLDCLHLNIYVPSNVSTNDRLAVMVWIHGGAYVRGSNSRSMYGPDYLVRHNVIVVSLNYRLGAYGFMCLDHPEVPGNQGLKDQVMGLRWVRNNIELFGGDVNRITIFGSSASAHSAELHLRSTGEKLYNNVIMQSGSAVASPVLRPPDSEAPMKLAQRLGLNTSNINDALAYLAPIDPLIIVSTSMELGISYRPCVERQFRGVENFINRSWVDTPVPKVANTSVLIGFNENEMMFTHINGDAVYFEGLMNIFTDRLTQTFEFDADNLINMERLVRRFYIGDEPTSLDVQWPIINFDSDFTYIHPVHRTINKFLESGADNIFYYMFAYSGGRNFYKVVNNVTAYGATHADEVGYLFTMSYLPEESTAADDQLIVDRMTMMWTNFAKFSNPTPERTDLVPIPWTPLTATSFNYMRIDTNCTVSRMPFPERMAFWDLFYDMNRDSQRRFEPSAASGITSHLVTLFLACLMCLFV